MRVWTISHPRFAIIAKNGQVVYLSGFGRWFIGVIYLTGSSFVVTNEVYFAKKVIKLTALAVMMAATAVAAIKLMRRLSLRRGVVQVQSSK